MKLKTKNKLFLFIVLLSFVSYTYLYELPGNEDLPTVSLLEAHSKVKDNDFSLPEVDLIYKIIEKVGQCIIF